MTRVFEGGHPSYCSPSRLVPAGFPTGILHWSAREKFEYFDLVGGDPEERIVAVRVDLGIVPLLPKHAGGDTCLDSAGGQLVAKVPGVKEVHGSNAPGPGAAP